MFRILVADNDANVREEITQRLEAKGHEVVAVEDGEMAVNEILHGRESRWDLVIFDWDMPKLSGPKAIRLLCDAGIKPPAILFSFRDMENMEEPAKRIGFKEVVEKPDFDRLISVVQEILSD